MTVRSELIRLSLACLFSCVACFAGCQGESNNQQAGTSNVIAADSPFPDTPGFKANALTQDEIAAGWIQLFDGDTLFGWTKTSDANWEVADGQITVSAGQQGFLRSNSQFGDFELSVDFKSTLGTNSGVFLHTADSPSNPATDCYELNIADVGVSPFPTGSFVGRQVAIGDEAAQKARDRDAWQTFHVVAQGGKFTVDLDGDRVLEYTDPQPLRSGHILLQFNSGPVAFRNVKLRPLGLQVMLTADTYMASWTEAGKQSATFTFADGELQVSGGPGQLESTGQFADFVLQSDIRVSQPELNSGIFFRNIPGQILQGYESQIHNGFMNGDRETAQDSGTGAIFRRVKARRVVANDMAWFTKTIVANGAHFAVWVNGYQVTDWTDEREPKDNPREGQRLAAGTFALQAHDPTTDLQFRNFKAAELPPRLE